LGYNFKLG